MLYRILEDGIVVRNELYNAGNEVELTEEEIAELGLEGVVAKVEKA